MDIGRFLHILFPFSLCGQTAYGSLIPIADFSFLILIPSFRLILFFTFSFIRSYVFLVRLFPHCSVPLLVNCYDEEKCILIITNSPHFLEKKSLYFLNYNFNVLGLLSVYYDSHLYWLWHTINLPSMADV